MINFGAPNWFWALLLLPLLIGLFVRAENRATERLRAFVSARLLPDLARTVDRRRRKFRFALTLMGVALAITALAKPRWGYTYQDVKRKGLDLIFAADTSRSMLSNDVAPTRLQRVKLAAQDLLGELQGDRVGLVAFAGRAFLQAPLTIDYDAAVEAINDLDTNTIPEGGTNISAAIDLAVQTYGKSAIGNRALIIFTDGEELAGDATKSAKAAADAGVRIFTVGVGTPEGSLIPINAESGGTAFVKDDNGQVVKSKLDEKRLKEIAETTGGFYIHLEGGARSMKQLFEEGLAKMQSGEIDERLSRQPIERYQWPLGAALLVFSGAFLLRERRRERARSAAAAAKPALVAAAIVLLCAGNSFAAAPGLDAYRNDNYTEAYQQFQKTLQEHPNSHAQDKIEFDAGTAAYKLGDYDKALEWFSRSLLSKDKSLQEKSHFNMGRTLEERGDRAKTNEKAIGELNNAQSHYEEALKIDPNDERAKANLDEVKKKIERLKQKPKESPTPPPQPPQQNKKQNQKDQQQKNQQQQQQKNDQDQQQQQSENDQQKQQQQAKNDQKQQPPNESPSPSPDDNQKQENKSGSSPSPSPENEKGNGSDKKENKEQPKDGEPDASPSASASPSPSDDASPSPSPGSGEGEQPQGSPSASPGSSPGKPLTGKVEGANEEKDKPNEPKNAEVAEAEPEKEGQMSEKQAQALLQSMKDEEQRVQLDERKAARHVYKDW